MVTIGLPCYNAGATLVWCVQSILSQTFTDWLLIAIDDGSKDETLSILKSYNDDRIKVIADGENLGLAARLNQIARITETELLFRMDSDDIMFPSRVEKQVAFMNSHVDCDLLGSEVIAIDNVNKIRTYRKPRAYKPSAYEVFKGEVIFHPTVCGRTQWFKMNPYDESLKVSEDYELWCRTIGELRVQILQEPLLFYREHGSFTYSKFKTQSRVTVDIIKKYGPEAFGDVKTLKLLFERHLKSLICGLASAFGAWQKILNLHGKSFEETSFQKVLDLVIADK